MLTASFTANRPAVLDEVFDGEAVLVNLATGRYYALCDYGTQIWAVVATGSTWPQTLEQVAELRSQAPGAIAASLLRYVHRLADEQLLLVEGELAPAASIDPDSPIAEPTLQSFTDMEDLLLLDPIHDIDLDGTGWPKAQQQPA